MNKPDAPLSVRTEWIGRKYPRVNSSKYKRTVHFSPPNQELSIFNQEKFNPLDSIISLVIKNSNDSSAKNLSKKKFTTVSCQS